MSSLTPLKLSVQFGIEVVVSKPVRPVRTVHLENPADPVAILV